LPSPVREKIQAKRENGPCFIDLSAPELESSNEEADSNDV